MKKHFIFIAFVSVISFLPAMAQQQKRIESPNKDVSVTIFSSPWGVPGYSMVAGGDTLVFDSQLGLKYTGSESVGHIIDKASYRWMQTDSLRNATYNEMTILFKQPYKGKLSVVARVYDNGIAFKQKYEVEAAEVVHLQGENTLFSFPPLAMVQQGEEAVAVGSLKEVNLPVVVKLADGKRLSISRGDDAKFPKAYLKGYENYVNTLSVGLRPMYEGNDIVVAVLPANFETPWTEIFF